MPSPGRNDACPCNSGKKFKKCCIGRGDIEVRTLVAKHEHERLTADREKSLAERKAMLDQVDVLQHQILVLKNFAQRLPMSPEVENRVRDIITSQDFQDAPADDLIAFMEPLIEKAGTDEAKLSTAVRTGILLWAAVTQRDPRLRVRALEMIEEKMKVEGDQEIIEFRIIAERMRKRHKFLFPDFWRAMHAGSE